MNFRRECPLCKGTGERDWGLAHTPCDPCKATGSIDSLAVLFAAIEAAGNHGLTTTVTIPYIDACCIANEAQAILDLERAA